MAEVDENGTTREYTPSKYETAAEKRAERVGDIAYGKYMRGERGVAGSYTGALKEKLQASAIGLKEKFDPLNVVQGVTGSRLLTTAAGRLMGRKAEDVEYFTEKSQGARRQRPEVEAPKTAATTESKEGVGGAFAAAGASLAGEKTDPKAAAALLKAQTKFFENVNNGKTILFPNKTLFDRMDKLYKLLDDRLTGGGGGGGGGGGESILDKYQSAKRTVDAARGVFQSGKNLFKRGKNFVKRTLGGKAAAGAAEEAGEAALKTGAGEAGEAVIEAGAKAAAGEAGEAALKAGASEAGEAALEAGAKAVAGEGGEALAKAAGKEITGEATEAVVKSALKAGTRQVGEEAVEAGAKTVSKSLIERAVTSLAGSAIPEIVGKALPFIGVVGGLGFAVNRIMDGDWAGAGLEIAEGAAGAVGGPLASIPIAVASIARDVYNAVYGIQPEEDPLFGERMGQISDIAYNVVSGMVKDLLEEKDQSLSGKLQKGAVQVGAAALAPFVAPAVAAGAAYSYLSGSGESAGESTGGAPPSPSTDSTVAAAPGASGPRPGAASRAAPVQVASAAMNTLEMARNASLERAGGGAPIIINNGGSAAPQVSPPPMPPVMATQTATTNGVTNRFEERIMGGRSEHLP